MLFSPVQDVALLPICSPVGGGIAPRDLRECVMVHHVALRRRSRVRLASHLIGPGRDALTCTEGVFGTHNVARLRRVLEPDRDRRDAGQILLTAAGYLLHLPAGHLDLDLFGDRIAQAGGTPDPSAREAEILEALGLWPGEPCAGLAAANTLDETHPPARSSPPPASISQLALPARRAGPLTGHTNRANVVAWSARRHPARHHQLRPRSPHLERTRGEPIHVLPDSSDGVNDVVWNAEGTKVATAGSDHPHLALLFERIAACSGDDVHPTRVIG
jgi:hypothetical protein